MTWKYRIVKHTYPADGHVYYDIREIYYNGSDLGWTKDSKTPIGDTPKDLKTDLKMMLKALDLPVLVEREDELVEVESNAKL